MKAKSRVEPRTLLAASRVTSRIVQSLACLVTSLLVFAGIAAGEPSLVLDTDGGDAWTFEKQVTASDKAKKCAQVRFSSAAGTALAERSGVEVWSYVPLRPGKNRITADCLKDGRRRGPSAEQYWTVRLTDKPKAWARTVPNDHGGISLDAGASEMAVARPAPIVNFEWRARSTNPDILSGLPARGREVELAVPGVDGEYYVTLQVVDAVGRSDRTTLVFRVRQGKAETVDLVHDHPVWVDSAVIYGVAPFFFGKRGFNDVTARLDELHALGINTLWLSPITATTKGDFGYAVTDFFRLRPEFGSANDFHHLIAAAHARGMRVIMDFVANHVSIKNAYFIDAEHRKHASAYYSFFERNETGKAAHYFNWDNLINLNYDNPEVQRWVLEAFSHWLREFDVDGFRVDAVWGPRQRAPEFWARWRSELKRIKPDVLLLAEASARDPYYFENGFDAAYDWTEALGIWAWRAAFEDPVHTARKLKAAIVASLPRQKPDALVFRFLNNNDTGTRFITRYGLARTRLAAAMLLSLPGVPQIYTGEDVGADFQPYDEGPPISWVDRHDLRSWYARLIKLRAQYAALQSKNIEFVDVEPDDQLLSYFRQGESPNDGVLVLINWGTAPASADLPRQWRSKAGGPSHLTDLITGDWLRSDTAILIPASGVRFLIRNR
jgi:cyclomaltodextrinase